MNVGHDLCEKPPFVMKDDGFQDHGLTFGNPDFARWAGSYGATGHRVGEGGLPPTGARAGPAAGGVHVMEAGIDYGPITTSSAEAAGEAGSTERRGEGQRDHREREDQEQLRAEEGRELGRAPDQGG